MNFKNYIKPISILIIVVGLLYLLFDYLIVATANGTAITRFELMHELEQVAGAQTLENLAFQKAYEKEVSNYDQEASQEEIDAFIAQISDQLLLQGVTLEEALEAQNITQQEFEQQAILQIKLRKQIERDLEIPEDVSVEERAQRVDAAVNEWFSNFQNIANINIRAQF